MRNLVLLPILLFVCSSCSDNNSSKELCNNFKWINYYTDTLVDVEHDISGERIAFITEIYQEFKTDCCSNVIFSLPILLGSDTVKLPFKCYISCSGCPHREPYPMACQVLMNKKGLILFEGKLIAKDSIDWFLGEFYSNYFGSIDGDRGAFEIFAAWDFGIHEDKIKEFFLEILTGYKDFLVQESKKTIHKDFCELTKTEIITLMNAYPICFRMDFFGRFNDKGMYEETKL